MISILPVLPVAGPLATAGLMLPLGHVLPRRVPDIVSVLVALACSVLCAFMALHAGGDPLTTWFGGWTPRPGLVIGISFQVDQAGAALGAFIGLLFALSVVFAWGFFDSVHAHFHVLMLLFMAGMTGFCLTHDLFNLFVWFEVMSVAGFALTGYQLRTSALEAALNFTVVNTLGAYLILGGIGLIYARIGALDFTALSDGIRAAGPDPVVTSAFALLASGLLIKAAQVPFHFWLSDAHAVAPSPVSVIFSGAMVALGLFGVARLVFSVFDASADVRFAVHTLLLGMGAASAILGGVMALLQRHLKRLLAFSTISHAGIMLIGLALLSQNGVAGMLAYLFGHGLVKGALFMTAGILLSALGGIDEIALRGQGRRIWPVGIAMAGGGLLLAGLPVGLMDEGTRLMAPAPLLHAVIVAGCVLTGAAVLRAAGRIFLGAGAAPGEEASGPTEQDRESADRPLWLMLTPACFMLCLAVAGPWLAQGFFTKAAAAMLHAPLDRFAPADAVPGLAWLTPALALALAGASLARHIPLGAGRVAIERLTRRAAHVLQEIHSGLIGDYVAWATVGLALFALAFA